MDEPKRRPGRPIGSGAQLSPVERNRKSRKNMAAEGATRLDFYLAPAHADQLAQLMQHWDIDSRKEAVQRALDIVHQTIANNRKAA
ncbi:hypothetical protein [Massilia sp. TN1-12]|uniref:hypothetical protein n=1 Tax=Massilia paldalensis TaxID=3377675 RepID=UPI00384B04AD